jgi:pimeloyl-ACP methyl ester carboxylesterase
MQRMNIRRPGCGVAIHVTAVIFLIMGPRFNRFICRTAAILVVTLAGCHAHNLPVAVDSHVLIFNEDGRACDSHRNFRQMPEAMYVNQMDSVLSEMDRYHAAHPQWVDHKPIRRILIFIHGGLNQQDKSLERDAIQYKAIQQAGYYPIFINWDSDLFSAYWEHLLWIRQGRKEMDPVRRFGQVLTSPLYLLADVGRAVTRAPSVWVHLGSDDADAAGNRWVSVHSGQPHWLENDESLYAAKYYSALQARYASTEPTTPTDQGQIHLSMGAEETTANFWRWDSLKYIVTMPAKLLTTPVIDSLGKSAWDVLCRRTVNLFEDPLDTRALGASDRQMAQLLDYGPPGDLQWFLHKLQDHIDADPNGANYEITLIGHSMGAMVINELLRHNPNLEIKNIVFMAAACSIHDFRRDTIPYMQAHSQTQVYNLCLHPTAEVTEADVDDLAPRGSLLVWIDEFLGEPLTPLDRTLGRWDNILPATYVIPRELRDRINIKAFAMTANGNRTDPETNEPAPQIHSDFTWSPYWETSFRAPKKPNDPHLLKLIDQLNARLAEVERDLPPGWKFKEETTRDQFRGHQPATQKAVVPPDR